MATKLDKIEKSFLKRKYILLKTQALYYSFKIVLETKFSWITVIGNRNKTHSRQWSIKARGRHMSCEKWHVFGKHKPRIVRLREKNEVKQGKRQNEAVVNSFTESKRRLGVEQQHLLVCRYCLKGQKRGGALWIVHGGEKGEKIYLLSSLPFPVSHWPRLICASLSCR